MLGGGAARADREPALKQVDLPHSYYWRELYLPQLTTGPSSASFTPDGRGLVYSMAGSLWRQDVDSIDATELTHAAGAYDYQPDVGHDGRTVVFCRYDGVGIEVWRLDLESGREQQLTSGGDVNVEPRLSPDGKRIAWVSTRGTGHLNLFLAELDATGLRDAHPLLGERRSTVDRYYYSVFDHAVNPSWSPDGATIYYVGNAEVPLGSGDIWAVPVADPSARRKVLSEETTWSAHPEQAPEGRRLLYSSYRGRQWHQLWLTTTDGAAPLPLTFGDFDSRNARWSPDGRRVVYVSNERGNTSLVVQDVVGGARQEIVAGLRRYKVPRARLVLDVVDPAGKRVPARVSVLADDGRAYAPANAWMHADDGFDRSRQTMETHYFHCSPPCTLEVPGGAATVTVQHGFAALPWRQRVELPDGRETQVRATLAGNALPPDFGHWVSADLHVHMNYGGHYRNTPAGLARQAESEDLGIVYNLVVNKEERVPDLGYFRTGPDPASNDRVLILQAQEFHTSFWGHLGLLYLSDHLITPDFSSYRHTALASPYPYNGVIADLAHAQGALVGYVHPFDWPVVPEKEKTLSHELPADVISGKVDYIEVVGFSDHKATAEVWYRLLNLGFRLPAGAGTDAMANYASLRGPVGLNRVFLNTGGRLDGQAAKLALKSGRSFVSNGPLLGFDLGGARPGDTLKRGAPGVYHYRVALRSPVPVDHLEIVRNGKVVRQFVLAGDRRSFDGEGDLPVDTDGWAVLRAWNDSADPLVLDLYPYATTSPIYLDLPGEAPPAPEDAAYFVRWLDRVIAEAQARTDYNDERERSSTLGYLAHAREAYAARAGGAAR
ncbi:MAG: hypothetical protein FIB04_12325 [Gammaproteobacteria bacterium]|nr:hypothetical protein [Gammaproteobacteria bacterium]